MSNEIKEDTLQKMTVGAIHDLNESITSTRHIISDFASGKFQPYVTVDSTTNINKEKLVQSNKPFTQYQTGALKETKGKRMYQLVTKQMMDALADVLTYGALHKYAPNNWRLGQPFTEIMRAAEGHFQCFKDCIDIDEDSGLHHLEQAFTNIGFIITHIRCGRTDLDDRYKGHLIIPQIKKGPIRPNKDNVTLC